MWLIHVAMRRPITVLMVILGVALASALALNRMKATSFPTLGRRSSTWHNPMAAWTRLRRGVPFFL